MAPMHSLLQRQLKRHFGEKFTVPPEWQAFLTAVSDAYQESDVDRAMVERSLELSSQELLQANSEMRAVVQAIPDLLLRLDDQGNILNFKAGATSDLLLQHREFFGKRIQDIPVHHISMQFRDAIQWVLRERTLVSIGYSITLQGQVCSFEARLLPLLETQIIAIIQNVTDRKRAEDVLRQKQDQLLEALRIAHLAYWEYDVPGDRFLFNDQFYSILHTTAEQEGGYTMSAAQYAKRFVHPDDLAVVGAEIQKALASTDPNYSQQLDHRIICADGKTGYFSTHIRIQKDAHGRTIKTHGAKMDITERKRAEEELRHTVSLLQSTFNSTADGILVVDRVGRIISFNERFLLLWQIPQKILDARDDEAAIAHVLSQLKNPDAFVQKVRELYADAGAESFDVLDFKDGRVFERYSCPQRLDGAPIGRVWSFRDVTERKRSEESLLKLSRVVEQTADSVLITNAQGVIEYVNPSFVAMTGYTKEDIVGQTPRVLKSGRHEPEFFANLWRTILSGRVFRDVLINRKKNGDLYYAEKTITPIKDGSGVITHFVSTEKDITEHKQLEAQLRQSQKMEAFGQLAAGVAHDFNNILMVIMGNASLLKMGKLSEASQASATTEISRAGERAANLTRQLLTFSRRQLMQSKDLDLNDVVANITKMLQRLIGEHIALETHYAPGGAPVHADPSMMEQVLMNLAVNSRDAMPKGGRLLLRTATTVIDLNQTKTRPNARAGRFVRLSVSDTGEGIAPENLPHIFEPFFTTKGIGKGTGLGLATVFGIAAQHHGWIEVESQPGSGTTFHVYFPRLTKDAASLAEPDLLCDVPGGTETILLVEDEEPVRQLMHDVLASHGYRIHTAVSGVHALEVWKKYRDQIDLLVTDMVMPDGINGRELADRLLVEKPDLRIIYCSGYTDDMLGKDSPLRHNENFLEKPFEPNKLLERVRRCVDAKR